MKSFKLSTVLSGAVVTALLAGMHLSASANGAVAAVSSMRQQEERRAAEAAASAALAATAQQQAAGGVLSHTGFLVVDLLSEQAWYGLKQSPQNSRERMLKRSRAGLPVLRKPTRENPFMLGCVLSRDGYPCVPLNGVVREDWTPLELVQYYARRTDIRVTAVTYNPTRGDVTVYYAKDTPASAVK